MLCLVPQELEVLKELPEAFLAINREVSLLQTQPCYQSGGQKLTFCKFFIY